MRHFFRASAICVSLALALAMSGAVDRAHAQPAPSAPQPTYLTFGQARGLYYLPAGPAPHVAFLAIHRTADYLQHPSCLELPKRGYAALCMNTRFINSEFDVDWDRIALDV